MIKENVVRMLKASDNAPEIITVAELNAIPDNSIVFYPVHSDWFGEFLTGKALKQWVKDNYDKLVYCGHLKDEGLFTPEFHAAIKESMEELKDPESEYELLWAEDFKLPCVSVTSDPLDRDEDDDEIVIDEAGKQFAKFIWNAQMKGYTLYSVPYCGGNQGIVEHIRSYWIFD